MQRSQSGAILIISLLILIVITGVSIATFSITDTNSKITQNNREQSILISLANSVLDYAGQVLDKARDYSCASSDVTGTCLDFTISSIPKTCTAASSCQIWTYGQVSAKAPSGIMDNSTYAISWWNTYGSNNAFTTQNIPSQYTTKYIIEAQPYDSTNYLSTYKIIAFVANTTTGQSITKQKMYYAKNAYIETVVVNELQVTVGNDTAKTPFYSSYTSNLDCSTGITYRAANRNITLFNVQNSDVIYLNLVWKKFTNYTPVQTTTTLWSSCPGTSLQGGYYRYYMPAIVGQATWNTRTLTTSAFNDNPNVVSDLNRFKSVYPKYTIQATLNNSIYNWWAVNYGLGATIPGTAKWLFPEMLSLWVMPDTVTGVNQTAAATYCSSINSNTLATTSNLSNAYSAYLFSYWYRYAWVATTNYAAYVASGPQYWYPASGALGAWCYGVDQNIYLPTQTGSSGADRRWPIASWYPPDQAATTYTIKVQFSPQVPL